MVCDCQPCKASSDHSVSARRHGDVLCCIVRGSCWAGMPPGAGFAADRRYECAQCSGCEMRGVRADVARAAWAEQHINNASTRGVDLTTSTTL